MISIDDIKNSISSAPTFMGAKKEIFYIEEIYRLSINNIDSEVDSFFEILDRLDESHSNDAYFEVDETNKDVFLKFSIWLESLGSKKSMESYKEDFDAYATTFKLMPSEIYNNKE